MVYAYDLSKIRHAKPGLVKIAWLRNWFDRWAERACFDDYDIYLCSSRKGAEFIEGRGKKVHIFPIATNEKRFKPEDRQTQYFCDYCFTGHKWGVTRDIEVMLDPTQLKYKFAVYGNNWDNHDRFGQYWKGFVQYSELPSIYSSTRIVIDDVVNDITKPWGSVNSRVFDALSCGALVITNDVKGSQELFDGKLPVYETSEELQSLLNLYLGDENKRLGLVAELRKSVLENHTYTHRAYKLQSILIDFFDKKFRIAIKVPVPKKGEADEWGDYHFALALKRAFVKLGHSVRIDLLPDWDTQLGFGDNVVIVLRGLSKYKPKSEHINLMWNISHPDKITSEEYELYDHIFVASHQYADKLSKEISKPVTSSLQCTDTNLFYPELVDQVPEHKVLFVGNSRKQYRTIVKHAIESGLPVSIYGTLWEKIVPKEYIKGTHIKNTELRLYYSKCGVLLNDHWPSMGDSGFISNRIFDAGACGACIVSDEASGISDLFGDAVVIYRNAAELKHIVNDLLSNREKREAKGEKLRAVVSTGHSFENRVEEILKVIEEIDSVKPFDGFESKHGIAWHPEASLQKGCG
jgi:spore maturation protein CgeB